MKNVKAMLVALLVAGLGSHCFAQAKPHLEIAGLGIAKKDPKSEFGRGLSQFRTAGTEVDLYVVLPGQTILSLDQKQSQVTLRADDGGELPLREQSANDLLALNLKEDRSSASIQLGSENLPGKKCTTLSLSGSLVLVVGKDKKTEVVELKVAKGTKVKLGSLDVTLGGRDEPSEDPASQIIELTANAPFDGIEKIEFLDSQDKVVENEPTGSGSYSLSGVSTYSSSYYVKSAEKKLKVRVSYFAKTESVTLPVKLECGLGL